MKLNSVISRWVRGLASAAGVFGMALLVMGCETESAAEFACSREFSPRPQVEACKIGIQYAHEIGNEQDANKSCSDRYTLEGVSPDSEDGFDQAFANANLFHACTRGVKGYLDFQEPAARERILQQVDAGVPSAGVGGPAYGECVDVAGNVRCY